MDRSVLDMNNVEAKEFFMKNENYCNIGLPQYFNFTSMLEKIDKLLIGKKITIDKKKLKNCNDEHLILNLIHKKLKFQTIL